MSIGSEAVNYTSKFILGSIQMLSQQSIGLLIMYFLFYYLLTGEDSIFVHKIYAAIPFNEENTSTLVGEFSRIVRTTMISNGAVALFQGALLTITFLIVKIQGAFLWGSIATLLSFLPVFGSTLVWVPATVIEFLLGDYTAGSAILAVRDICKYSGSFSQAHDPKKSWKNPSFFISYWDYHRSITFWIARNHYRPPSPFLLYSDLRNVLQGVPFLDGVKI